MHPASPHSHFQFCPFLPHPCHITSPASQPETANQYPWLSIPSLIDLVFHEEFIKTQWGDLAVDFSIPWHWNYLCCHQRREAVEGFYVSAGIPNNRKWRQQCYFRLAEETRFNAVWGEYKRSTWTKVGKISRGFWDVQPRSTVSDFHTKLGLENYHNIFSGDDGDQYQHVFECYWNPFWHITDPLIVSWPCSVHKCLRSLTDETGAGREVGCQATQKPNEQQGQTIQI